MSFWGHILGKKGPFGPKWSEIGCYSGNVQMVWDPAPQGPYIGSGPLKTRYFRCFMKNGYLDFEESDLFEESL